MRYVVFFFIIILFLYNNVCAEMYNSKINTGNNLIKLNALKNVASDILGRQVSSPRKIDITIRFIALGRPTMEGSRDKTYKEIADLIFYQNGFRVEKLEEIDGFNLGAVIEAVNSGDSYVGVIAKYITCNGKATFSRTPVAIKFGDDYIFIGPVDVKWCDYNGAKFRESYLLNIK